MRSIRRSLVPVIMVLAVACSGDSTTGPGQTGTVTGVITAANGITPIAGAEVTLATGGSTGGGGAQPSTTTDANGVFTLGNVPIGVQTIVATRGSFATTFQVNVQANTTVEAPPAALEPVGGMKLGYVPGAFDNIQNVVAALGYEADQLTVTELGQAAVTSQYHIIFLNCGMNSPTDAAIQNLRTFMQNGGLVYASDWSIEWAEDLLPEDFLASDGNNDSGTYPGTVVEPDLALWLQGATAVQLRFNLGGWERVTSASNRTTVLIRGTEGTLSNQPLAVMVMPTAWQGGGIVYTSFHNAAQVTDEQSRILEYFVFR